MVMLDGIEDSKAAHAAAGALRLLGREGDGGQGSWSTPAAPVLFVAKAMTSACDMPMTASKAFAFSFRFGLSLLNSGSAARRPSPNAL